MRIAFAVLAVFVLVSMALAVAADNPTAVLQSDAGYVAKADACRALVLKGSPEAVAALAPLLSDAELSHMARLALEAIPGPEVDAALRDALDKTSGKLQVGIVNSLAKRRDVKAIPGMAALLSGDDAVVAQAAARGLGTIATSEAASALEAAVCRGGGPPGTFVAYCDGLMACTEAMADGQAAALYDLLREHPQATPPVRAAALRGAVLARDTAGGLPILVAAIRDADDSQFDAALRTSRELCAEAKVMAGLAGALPDVAEDRKIRVMEVLGHCGSEPVGPVLMAEAQAGPTGIRVAALRALTRIAYVPALELMQELAHSDDGALAEAARHSLSYFPGAEGDALLRTMLTAPEAEDRRLAVELVGQGGLDDPVELLMRAAQDDSDEGVRVAALQDLRTYAGMDQMPRLLDLLLATPSDSERGAAESALKALSTRQQQAATGEVVIREAVYGDLPDGASADVTKRVAAMVDQGAMKIEATNGNFGDSAPGIPKRLRVSYTVNGAARIKSVEENKALLLSDTVVPESVVDAFCAAHEKAQGDAELATLRLLAVTGSAKALEIVQDAAFNGEGALKETAMREFCGWPTVDAFPAVMELATTSSDPTVKVLALRGAVRLLRQGYGGAGERLVHLTTLMAAAGSDDNKKLVLSGLGQIAHVDALEVVFREFANEAVKAEAIQAAIAIAEKLGNDAQEDEDFLPKDGLAGWSGSDTLWRYEDGAIVGHSDTPIARNEFIWAETGVRDFYLEMDVKLTPNTANAGIQFRSESVDEHGQALGYQADAGQDVWGRLYHEHGRGKLDWTDSAEAAVRPGEWNRYEILAVGPAIWTAINGRLGVAFLDLDGERAGQIALQIHGGPPQTVHYRITELVHNPRVRLGKARAEKLIKQLK